MLYILPEHLSILLEMSGGKEYVVAYILVLFEAIPFLVYSQNYPEVYGI